MKRQRLDSGSSGGLYFTESEVERFSSGCSLLDCALGGGWPVGRIVNLVGDKSTGKTLLAIEACANFLKKFPNGELYYAEVEAAFDIPYAQSLGLPKGQVNFPEDVLTVEDVFESLTEVCKVEKPSLYVVDSLDALSDRTELTQPIDKGSYGAAKAKQLSQLFRRLVQELAGRHVTVFIISQVRDNIGVTFGKTTTRSGGRALDFYSSQVVWLAHLARIKKVRKGVERTVGVSVKATVEKNKVGMPFRDVTFPILFGFGVEDVTAGIQWLISVGRLDALTKDKGIVKQLDKMDNREYSQVRRLVARAVRKVWREVEARFQTTRRKY